MTNPQNEKKDNMNFDQLQKEWSEKFQNILESAPQNGKPIFIWPNGNTNWDAVKSFLSEMATAFYEAGQMAVHSKDGAAFDAGLKRGMELALSKVREAMPKITSLDEAIYPFEKFEKTWDENDGRNSAIEDILAAITKLEEEGV